jgi:hypothetical protein
MDLIRSAAMNLVELNPDVILAVGGRVIPILMELTRSIPIVTPGGSDPIARGYAESLARPGGKPAKGKPRHGRVWWSRPRLRSQCHQGPPGQRSVPKDEGVADPVCPTTP